MIIEENLKPIFDSIDPNIKTVSVLKRTLILRDGELIGQENHRCAFVPGDIERVKEYIGETESPEIDYLNAIWTEEVISSYNEKIPESI